MARKRKADKPLTTAERLNGIIKSCRKIMRKDRGLNGDLDRLPMLTWIMFLKFLDDMEQLTRIEPSFLESRFVQLWKPRTGGETGRQMTPVSRETI